MAAENFFPKIPIGDAVAYLVDVIEDYLGWFFDAISYGINYFINGLQDILIFIPPVILIAIIAIAAWYVSKRSYKAGILTAAGLLLILNLELWEEAMQTLALVITSSLIALVIGIPVGIHTSRNDYSNRMIRPLLDFMQTMPSFVYLIPAVIFFGLGNVPGVIATIIFAIPPAIRLTNLGIRQVPKELNEVADSFGATPMQKLVKVQIPVAMPSIMAGINQCILLALSMTVIASMIGAAGLGLNVLEGIQRVDIGGGFEAGLAIVIIAIILDRITQNIIKN
ncbi:glycine betaine/proline transport system permease protein [Methanomicrobium sp. W14]|uniref:ABC transporter permease n=1 Tax=Methanomicrobium sp. W14 TaxID=2817839 RepID=UPI001AE54A47|nr:ABC transporter permease subunit [Methanomicrobium sp. W14]MBP2133244.1 glycine betaine/proline transport system permease protein [Methanomicrobium sp. W14]